MKLLVLVGVVVLLLFQGSCSIAYVAKQGYYQAKLICGSIPIEQAIQNPALSKEEREKLELVMVAREYGIKNMALTPGSNYTTVNLDWHVKLYNVSASPPLLFKPYTWWFPVIGSIPYKGFFDIGDAEKTRDELKAEGYDVLMRGVGGYSTLGYFSDPVWPEMLKRSEPSLVELIIHETAHATVYFNSQSDFNESFANFVGKQGAVSFLEHKYGKDSEILKKTLFYYGDEDKYLQFMWELYKKLDDVYKSQISDADKLAKKQAILDNVVNDYKNVGFKSKEYRENPPDSLNNAKLMSFKLYNSDQEIFAQLFQKVGGDWAKFIEKMKSLEKSKDPLSALKELVSQQ